MHPSNRLIQQFPVGSDTALPKGINYQSEEISSLTKSHPKKEHEQSTIETAVELSTDNTTATHLTSEGTIKGYYFQDGAGKEKGRSADSLCVLVLSIIFDPL